MLAWEVVHNIRYRQAYVLLGSQTSVTRVVAPHNKRWKLVGPATGALATEQVSTNAIKYLMESSASFHL